MPPIPSASTARTTPTARRPPPGGVSARARRSVRKYQSHVATASRPSASDQRPERIADGRVSFDQRGAEDAVLEPLAGRRGEWNHRDDEDPHQRDHDAEAAPGFGPERDEQQAEGGDRHEHDHEVHEEHVQRQAVDIVGIHRVSRP